MSGAGRDPKSFSEPGPEHSRLMTLAGEYATTTRFVGPAGPIGNPLAGRARLHAVGGRFLVEEHAGQMGAEPVAGLRTYAFNNATGRYEGCASHGLSTALMTLSGTSADGGITIDFDAVMETPGGRQAFAMTLCLVAEDRFTLGIRATGGAGPVIETTYVRRA